MYYDFTLFYSDCNQDFASFEKMAAACVKKDHSCTVEPDFKAVVFSRVSFYYDFRQKFIQRHLNDGLKFVDLLRNQIRAKRVNDFFFNRWEDADPDTRANDWRLKD